MIERLAAVTKIDVSRETFRRLEAYVELLISENERQNLIARSTVASLWERHIIDSAQLVPLLSERSTLDIGSGAGLPGVVLAILSPADITLVEPRRLRVEFLQSCIEKLELRNVTVVQGKAEGLRGRFDAITARAVAPIGDLFASAIHLSHPGTVWVLPKGGRGQMELAAARDAWQGRFRTEPSATEGEAVIVVASNVSARRKGRG
jgi:16S rRNA (guanine527-N7)-methyltransferase